ncbi:MAG: hypothetical protein ACKOFV_05825 [Candidatus Nanopelagicaceae bacterium]
MLLYNPHRELTKLTHPSIGGMGITLIAMFAAAFGYLTSSQGALLQEAIDVAAILWALTTLKAR